MRMFPCQLRRALVLSALALLLPCAARGQSGDVRFPTPVYANEIAGRIAPRDIGDPRRTRHFYIFRGTEGDISVTLESAELNGAVDLFTAGTLRPLLKITLFGGPTAVTKSVFLRREETLVLRVEARAAGEAEGTYRISLGGTFAPAPAGLAEAPAAPEVSGGARGGRGVRRVTSTGARIEEPAPPAVEARAEPSPTPSEAATGEEAAPGRNEERPAAREEAPRSGRRAATPRRRRGRAAREGATTNRGGEAAATTPPAEAVETAPPATAPRPAPRRTRARPPRRNAPRPPAATAATPTPEATAPTPEAPGPRLIIVTKDGETLERDMRTVRRVTVENNQLVVVTRDGKVIRQPMSNVARMAIEP